MRTPDLKGRFLEVLPEVWQRGWALLEHLVERPACRETLASMPTELLRPAPRLVGRVSQDLEQYVLEVDDMRTPVLHGLVKALETAAGRSSNFRTFRPNEVLLQRYRRGSRGISPHRDSNAYRGLIVSLTLEGHARFTILSDQDPEWSGDSFPVRAGDAVLIRAAPLVPSPGVDACVHQVDGPEDGDRIALTVRMRQESGSGLSGDAASEKTGLV